MPPTAMSPSAWRHDARRCAISRQRRRCRVETQGSVLDEVLIVARAAHYASLVQLSGIFVFLAFVAEPAFGRIDERAWAAAAAFRARLRRYVWASLALALVSGLVWLLLLAAKMSGRSWTEALFGGLVGTVLSRTQFGRDWELRFVVALFLTAWLFLHDSVRRQRPRAGALIIPLLLSNTLLATLAWAGHATDTTGRAGVVALSADVIHLLAAGAWLGGLVPLVEVFATARKAADPDWAAIARAVTGRFSTLGLVSVGGLVITGTISTWFLVGTIPAFVGTAYGQILAIKLALFGAMVGVAAINRLRLTPRLLASQSNVGDLGRRALRFLQRNSLIEASLGLVVLVVVGVLGILPPAEHTQPWWPFAFKLSTTVLSERSGLQADTIVAVVFAQISVGLFVFGMVDRRHRVLSMMAALAFLFGAGGMTVRFFAVKAYPTSFFQSLVPYTTLSITAGAHLYAGKCAACHGETGRGDGRVVKDVTVPPVDLTTGYLLAQSDGDLFWWVSHGRANGSMPAFADVLGANQRWDLVNFLHAQASGARAITLTDVVPARAYLLAPDFAFEDADGRQETLASQRGQDVVLLVFFTEPESRPRLEQLARDETYLERAGVRILAISRGKSVDSGEPNDRQQPTFPFVVKVSSDVLKTYALFERKSQLGASSRAPHHIEFLIDRAGYMRARWSPDENSGWTRISDLLDQVWRLERLGTVRAAVGGHVH